MYKVLFLGPKVQDLGGFVENDLQQSIQTTMGKKLQELSQEHDDLHVLTSLHLGIETWAAEISDELKINTHVYIPFNKPYNKWPQSSQKKYLYLLKKARQRFIVSEGEFTPQAFNECRTRMIEDSDMIYHFFPNGDYSLKIATKLNKAYEELQTEDDDYYIEF